MGIERRARGSAPARYRPHRPSESVLYRCAPEHLETWLAQCRDGHDDEWSVPEHVEREFRRYLDCGNLTHSFARARCGECGHDFLIAFSCKGRGVCPSCNARRMVATAAHLADHVLPDLPVRQWVLAVPKRLRYFLQRDADLQGAALRLFLRRVEQCLRAHSPGSSSEARLGAVAFIHRLGSSLNAHLHFHCVVIDGVFDATPTGGVVFDAAIGLEANAIAQVQAQVRRRLLRVFVRRGLLPADDAQAMGQWQHGGGFSVDASVRIEATDRTGRERLLRYCARPPSALDRLRELDREHLIYNHPKRGPGGSGPQLLTPLELLDRLAALMPPPRLHRYRHFGVLAPNSPLRASTSWALAPANGESAECAPLSSFCGSRRAISWPGLTLSTISTVRWQADKNVSAHSASATRRKAIGPQWRSRDSVDTGQRHRRFSSRWPGVQQPQAGSSAPAIEASQPARLSLSTP